MGSVGWRSSYNGWNKETTWNSMVKNLNKSSIVKECRITKLLAESGGSCASISSVKSRSCFVQTHEINMW